LPVAAALDELNEPALLRILTEPRNALVTQYKTLFEMEGVELDISHDALEEIVARTMKRKTGARGLRSIMERALQDIMFEIPSMPNLKKVTVTGDVVRDRAKPKLKYADTQKKSA